MKQPDIEEKKKALDLAVAHIKKQFGDGSIMALGKHSSIKGIEVIKTGALSLDLALGIGGIPKGRIVEIYGPESSGKSTLATHIVANAQKAGGIAAYIDAEHALDPSYAAKIGVNLDELMISQPDSGEEALNITEMLARSNALDVIVIDSVAALVPKHELEGEIGEAGMFFDGKRLKPFACEGGHADFAPQNEIEIELLKFLQTKYGHVSYERVLSGSGIYNLYEFLVENEHEPKDEALDEELKNHAEPQVIITKKGMTKENKTCERVLDWFSSMYGAEAGNAALKFFALGGVYIGGGIAPRILDVLESGSFMKAFADKGRFAKLMMSMPVKVILNDRAALIGASNFAIINKDEKS